MYQSLYWLYIMIEYDVLTSYQISVQKKKIFFVILLLSVSDSAVIWHRNTRTYLSASITALYAIY